MIGGLRVGGGFLAGSRVNWGGGWRVRGWGCDPLSLLPEILLVPFLASENLHTKRALSFLSGNDSTFTIPGLLAKPSVSGASIWSKGRTLYR